MANITQHITYKNAQYPVRISYYAIKKFQEETKKPITQIDEDIALLEVLLWYGLIAGHSADNKPMELKREDMEFILDESMTQFNDIILNAFPDITDESTNKKK